MNKKIVTLIIVILISFCFLSIVVADNATHDNDNTTDHNSTIDKNTTGKDKKTDHDKTDDDSKKNYILAKGKGNNIKFSDGFRGFILDYSKSSASSGDEFKHVSSSKADISNTLKLVIIECYKQNSTDKIGKIIADFVKTGLSNSKVGEVVEDSHKKISDHEVVKIDDDTEAIFDFEVLKSVSGNESDYFAYKVSFKTIHEDVITNQTNNQTNVTNTTNTTNTTNITNTTNLTGLTQPIDNETNATFFDYLYDYLAFLANAIYDEWKPFIETLMNYYLMFVNALQELTNMFDNFMAEIQSLLDAFDELLNMLESLWKDLTGILKLLGVLLTAIQQLFNLFESVLNFIAGLISSIISLVQQIIGLLSNLIGFIIGLLSNILNFILGLLSNLLGFILGLFNQLMSFIQAILDFLNSLGSSLAKVLDNAVTIIVVFVVIAIGAVVYNRIR